MDMTHFDEEGNFNDSLYDNLPTLLEDPDLNVEDYRNAGSIDKLFKNHYNLSKKLGQKLENVIQKPGENATEEEIAEYNKTLMTEAGLPDNAEGYAMNQSEIPENMRMSTEKEAKWRNFFFENNVPKSMGDKIFAMYATELKADIEAHLKATSEAYDTAHKALTEDKDWAGDKFLEKARAGLQLLRECGGDQVKKDIDESGIYDSPGDKEKLKKAGLHPEDLKFYANLAERTKSSKFIPSSGTPKPEDDVTKAARNMYTHKTSQELIDKRQARL